MVVRTFAFVDTVVDARDLIVTHQHDHECRLEPRESELAWHCDLFDGTPPSWDDNPASHVRWVCPDLRLRGSATHPRLDVRRSGPHSDLGRLLGRLTGRRVEDGLAYTDPEGILDADLRDRIEHWPTARHGDGVVRPAELWSITITREGLVVTSTSWWDSSAALDHQLGLAWDVAVRLTR